MTTQGQIAPNPIADQKKAFIGKKIEKPPTGFETLGRLAGQGTARVLEAGLGFPGNIQNLVEAPGKAIRQKLTEKITGEPYKEPDTGLKFPTSGDIRENVTKKIFGEYLEPKNGGEKIYGDFVHDATEFYLTGGRGALGKAVTLSGKTLGQAAKIGKALWTSAAGHAVGETAGVLGASPNTQDAARIGTMLLVGAADRKGAEKFVDNLYDQADAIRPKGTILSTTNAQQQLTPLLQKTSGGISIPEKTAANTALKELEALLSRGTATVDEVIGWRSDLLKKIRSMKREGLDPSQYEATLNQARNVLEEVMTPLERTNPEWYKLWRSANQGYKGLHDAGKISLKFEKAAEKANVTPEMHAFLNEMAKRQSTFWGSAKSAVKYPAIKFREVWHRITTNPTLRGYYIDATLKSAQGNVASAGEAMEKLDKAMAEEDKRTKAKKFIPKKK